jgi:hypothetical protein
MLKRLCQCIGLSSLILVMNYGDLLGGGADVRMHVPFALGGIVAAQIAGILLLGIVMFIIIALLQRTRFYNWVRLVLAVIIPPYLIQRTEALYPFVMKDGLVPVLAAIWAALLLLLLLKFPRWYRRLIRVGDAVGIFFAVFALFSITQLLWVARWKPGPQQLHAAWETSPQPPRQHPLVVWIVFDELSYDQVFEHRAHDLELPNFDALRNLSTTFTNVQPIGRKTVRIIPSLLSGQVVEDFRYKFDNRFLVHDTGQRGFHALNGSGTIFHDAQQNGWRTAVVGWYNPYCGIYGDAIDDCYWMNLDRLDGMMAQRDSFWRNTYSPLQQVVREIKAPARADRDSCNNDVRQRLKTHLDLQQHAFQLLKTDQADFVFLHMSLPHSPNVWSRIDDRYTDICDSSYLDNLALTDRVLGGVLQTLQASPRWKDTTLIVQGDHGWRIDLWNWLPAWTDEDDAASHGVFDPRPALLVHQAGQTQPQTNAAAWSLLGVHDVLEQVVKGQPVQF